MANIFAQFAQPVRSVMDYQNDADNQALRREQLGAAQRTNALADLTAQQTRQTMGDTQRSNAIIKAAYAAKPGASDDEIIGALKLTGDRAALEHAAKLEDQRGKRAETDAKTREAQAKALTEVVSTVKRFATGVMANPSPQVAMQAIDDMEAMHKQFGLPGNFDAQRQQIAQMTSPDQIRQWAAGHMGNADLVTKKLQLVSNGKVQTPVDMNPVTNPAGPAPITMTTTPGEDLTATTSTANNKRTVGATLEIAKATRDAAATTAKGNVDAAKVKRDQDTEMKLADDYRAQSKEFGQSLSAHKQLTATLGSATTSPAATLAAATKFMKILDPGSVVRESELGMALAASGVIDRAMNYVSTLQSGQKLTPTQAKDFKNISDKMFVAAQQVQQGIDKDYQSKAKTYGLRPEMVVQDLGQSAKEISFGDLN